MISSVDTNDDHSINFTEFLEVIARQKELAETNEDSDVMDAWVAVGGDRPLEGGGKPKGIVDTDKLVKIVKHDFGLTIDIEKLVEQIDLDGSGTVDFDEFRQLLS